MGFLIAIKLINEIEELQKDNLALKAQLSASEEASEAASELNKALRK